MSRGDPRRALPSVHQVLELLPGHPPRLSEVVVRDQLQAYRQELARGARSQAPAKEEVAAAAEEVLRRYGGPTLRHVLNATGVLIHTNLGRSPLGPRVAEAILEAAGYCDLEFDLTEGRRSSRQLHVELLLRAHTGAEAAMVVNNNAAAVLLMLSALAAPGEVVISRGELVEIGGSFRIPDVMGLSGARLREVGTTNKTRLSDYLAALGPETKALLKVHRSNFVLSGFVADVSLAELAPVARAHSLWLLFDAGSGALFPIADEPTLGEAWKAGADVVSASGDKLLGAGQAGILLGRREAIEQMKRHPLYRALRPDKLTLAALKATLYEALLEPQEVLLWRMLRTSSEALAERAQQLAEGCRAAGMPAEVRNHPAVPGGGALPGHTLDSPAVFIPLDTALAGALQAELRRMQPPVVALVEEGRLILHLRSVPETEDEVLLRAVSEAWRRLRGA